MTAMIASSVNLPPYALASEEVLASLDSNAAHGLTDEEVLQIRSRTGPNRLRESPPVSVWKRILEQFQEVVIWLLLGAAVVAALLGEWADTFAVLAIVIMNAVLGYFQQARAEKALAALRRLSAPNARVVRDGHPRTVPADDLVPGDRLELEAGDHIPADARLLGGFGFRTQESALTGESEPTEKRALAILEAEAPLAERENMVYQGTVVVAGKASAVVTATGMNTELGKIAGLLQGTPAESTPLQKRLAQLGRFLVLLCVLLVAVVAVLHLLRGGPWLEVLRLAVSLAVAAVPEGLPAVVTISLALGLQRMVRRRALIRKLASVETLGSVTVICSDKTGTLTRNEMTLREAFVGGDSYAIQGSGYEPKGTFHKLSLLDSQNSVEVAPQGVADLVALMQVGVRCNHARLVPGKDGGWTALGDPTEAALIVAARKAGVEASSDVTVVHEEPFDSVRKAMSIATREIDGRILLSTKGAPESILARCSTIRWHGQNEPLSLERREEILQHAERMAGKALRVLALASRTCADESDTAEQGLCFLGLVGLIDPPRDEARQAVAQCRAAGIRPVMITGDHPSTALAIGRELGIASAEDRALTGTQLDTLDDEALTNQLESVSVFARVSPEHKLRVVRALKKRGHIVAMTGDGINDAPAVQSADIGVAMGITGTDVTKEASAMVLLDDNFATIVAAVEEGRGIFANIRKFVHYLLAGNANKLLVMFLAALLGWDEPLLALQILWLNLITDGLPALALGVERTESGNMKRPPRPPAEPIITWERAGAIVLQGMVIAAAALFAFHLYYQGGSGDLEKARVVTFCVMGFGQLFFALACRSQTLTYWQMGAFSNPALLVAIGVSAILQLSVVLIPFLAPVFGVTTPPTGADWFLILTLALLPTTVLELFKIVRGLLRPGLAQ